MRKLFVFLAACILILPWAGAYGDTGESTRVTDASQHASVRPGGYPYRDKWEYVLWELDLRPGDVVVDIGAGDGFWAEKMAQRVGPEGAVHAAEVDQKLVDRMKEKYATLPQLKPYLCPTDGTGLPDNSCDLAFLSKTYHHLPSGKHAEYWRHLAKVVKPTGRVCVIERYPEIPAGQNGHAWAVSLLMQQAEEGGWIPVRYELMSGTYHYLAIFVHKDLFPPQPEQRKPERTKAEATRAEAR